MATKDAQSFWIVSIVSLVAAVGIVVLLLNANAGGNVAGAAVAPSPVVATYSFWTTCLDQGNQVKLGNKEGDTLVKKDACSGSAVRGKQLAAVSCVQDVDKGFSYKYSNAEDCSRGTKCKLDENDAAYCG